MRQKTKILFSAMILTVAAMSSGCGSGSGSSSTTPQLNVTGGATDVSPSQVFTVTFPAPIKTSTVTAESFFIVPAPEGALTIRSSSTTPCDPTRALEALISCEDNITCSLSLTSLLQLSTNYIVCLTDSIEFDFGGNVSAQSTSFTTTAASTSTATLSSIALTPADTSIAIAATQQYTATGTYSDSSTATISSGLTWSSSDTSVATVSDSGLVTAVSAGTTTISVTESTSHLSGNTTLTVTEATPSTFTIGGTLTGLSGGTLVLQNNGGDNLSLTSSRTFNFVTGLASGATYAVTVLTPPSGQTCMVTNGSGTATANVTNVTVACSTAAQFLFPSDSSVAANFGASTDARTQANATCLATKNSSHSSLTCLGGVAAFISISSSDQLKDLPTKYSFSTSLPIQNAASSNAEVAPNWTTLLDGSTSLESAASAVSWWSGSDDTGAVTSFEGSDIFDCTNWTAADMSSATIGDASTTSVGDPDWISDSGGLCTQTHNLLCLCYQ